MAALVQAIRRAPDLSAGLPQTEAEIVRRALAGQSVYEIAQALRGPVETGGLGSDTDPGVTGGYGDTAFGAIGNEPPEPTPEEPSDME